MTSTPSTRQEAPRPATGRRDDAEYRVLIPRLTALERALDLARREASRAGEADIDEALGELHATVVDRRRREARSAG